FSLVPDLSLLCIFLSTTLFRSANRHCSGCHDGLFHVWQLYSHANLVTPRLRSYRGGNPPLVSRQWGLWYTHSNLCQIYLPFPILWCDTCSHSHRGVF